MTDTLTVGEDMDLTATPLPFGKQPVHPEETLDEYCATKHDCRCGNADTKFSSEYGDLRWICDSCRDARRARMSR